MTITVEGLGHRFRDRGTVVDALRSIDLEIPDGELLCVVGPSGCGKTTLLQILAGFLVPTAGRVVVDGQPVTGPGPDRGVVFQHPNLFPWMDVAANVALGPRLRGASRAEQREVAARHLALVGLEDFGSARPYTLSGGMQQRAQIARVLANDAAVLLMDEPFGALDALTRERLQDELLAIWRREPKTAVFITHSVEEAVYLGTRVLVMSARPGTITADVTVPFPLEDRGTALRTDAGFLALRSEVAAAIRG